jgi:hypothetical protein
MQGFGKECPTNFSFSLEASDKLKFVGQVKATVPPTFAAKQLQSHQQLTCSPKCASPEAGTGMGADQVISLVMELRKECSLDHQIIHRCPGH